jgi:hypothetical protein
MFIENAVETAKIAVDSCYVLRQFLTPLPSINFREIRGLIVKHTKCEINVFRSFSQQKQLAEHRSHCVFYQLCSDFLQVIRWQFSR